MSGRWEQAVPSCGYANKARVVQDVKELLIQTRSLAAKVEGYVFNDGKSAQLVSLNGTLPIFYRGNQYNIPIRIWVSRGYPNQAPIAYVTPTKGMRIHRGHPNVDESGVVYMSGNVWNHSSTLSTLCALLAQRFSIKPPVYAVSSNRRPPVVVARPTVRAQPQYPMSTVRNDVKANQQHNGYGHPSARLYQQANPYADPKAQLKEKLLGQTRAALTKRAEERLGAQTQEINRLLECKSKLQQGELYLTQSSAVIAREKEQLEKSIQLMQEKEKSVITWIEENKDKEIDVDKAIDGRDTWSRQILEEVAKDHAIEDAIYTLDKVKE